MQYLLAFLGTTLLVFSVRYYIKARSNARHPLPPGPRPIPLIGNVLDLPDGKGPEHEHWIKFKDLYGSISSVTVLGQTLVLLQEKQAVEDILEKTSKKTSGRPGFTFAKMAGYGTYLSALQNDASWRVQRKMLHQYMGTEKLAAQFNDIQDVESRRLLLRTLSDPGSLIQHFATLTGAIILKATYDYNVAPNGSDPLVELIDDMMVGFSIAFVTLSWMVDLLPSLRFLPWLSFQKTSRRLRAINYRVLTEAYSFVKRQMARGTYKPSITSGLIGQYKERFESDPGLEVAVQSAVAFAYGAGADTTSASLHGFVLSMVRNPEAQRKAQEEIDRVIGSERLPNADDRDNLLYVSALVQEVIRWFPIVPVNTTHAVDEEFHFNDYHFPKGSYITVSNWAILHDPQTYPDPFSFTPERFLEPRNEPSPANWAFGHGRRICPGRYLADDTLFVTISRLLATFSIERALDEKANPLDAKIGYTPGLVSHPTDFPFAIKPRSAAHAEFVRSLEKDCPWEEGHAKLLQEVSGTTSV